MSAEAQGTLLARRAKWMVESQPVRAVVTLALLGIVAAQIDWGRMGGRLSDGHPLNFVVAVALVLTALVIGACRWRLLLQGAGVDLEPRRLARIYAVSTFSSTFLPTTVGGDVTRALLVVRRGPLLTRVAVTIIVDRVSGLVGMLAIAWAAFAFQSATVPGGAKVFLAWVTAVIVLGTTAVALAVLRGSRLARALIPARLISIARESRTLLRSYSQDPVTLVLLLILSLFYQAMIALQLVMLAHAIGAHLPFATAAVTLALVTVVTLVPISIGGFGIREGSYVVLLAGASIGATEATLISLLSVATLFIASLPGAILLARGGVAPAMEGLPQ
jgi:glycosyltransferase 2 family protein